MDMILIFIYSSNLFTIEQSEQSMTKLKKRKWMEKMQIINT